MYVYIAVLHGGYVIISLYGYIDEYRYRMPDSNNKLTINIYRLNHASLFPFTPFLPYTILISNKKIIKTYV